MNMVLFPYALPLFVASAISLGIAYATWRRRPGPGVGPLAILMLALALWSLVNGLEILSTAPATKILLTDLSYIGIVTTPTTFLAFVLQFTGRERWLTRRNMALLTVFPLLTLVVNFSNSLHHLFRAEVTFISAGPVSVMSSTFGPAFWVHSVYSYLLLVIANGLLIQAFIRSPELYRGQIFAMLTGAFAPWVANALYIFEIIPNLYLDPTPFAFVITGATFGYALWRYRLMDVVPVARDLIFAGMSEAVMVLDARNRVIDLNPAATAILGAAAQATIGQPADTFFADRPELVERFGQVEEANAEIELQRGGAKGWFQLHISPLRNRRGDLTGRIFLLQDITRLKDSARQIEAQNEALVRTNQELAVARHKAEEANRLKSDFLANVSHELRTPLGSILGFVQLMLAGAGAQTPLSDKQRHNLERIFANGQELLNLINGLLDLAKIEAGRFELIEQRFRLQAWLDEIKGEAATMASRKNLQLRVECGDDLPLELTGDPARLKQIMLNLISNAVKFTEQGMVEVTVMRRSPDRWELRVIDSGIGIPDEAREYIFEPFRQVDGGVQRRFGGTGLGLSIVRNLVEMMGGSIGVESQVGKGSAFKVVLPLKPVEASVVL